MEVIGSNPIAPTIFSSTCKSWNHSEITFQGESCNFGLSLLHLIDNHVAVDVERRPDVTVSHEFYCTVRAVPTA